MGMFQKPETLTLKILAVAFPVLGGAFCLTAALGLSDFLCQTEGCRLYYRTDLFGLSLWWWGLGVFLILGLFGLAGRYIAAYRLSFLFLLLDALLLGLLALTLPCLSCLIAGLLFLMNFFVFHALSGGRGRPAKALVGLWFFLFAPNFFSLAQETLAPWPVYGDLNAPVRVYFAPSCPACRETIDYFLPNLKQGLVLLPVARSEGDIERVAWLVERLKQGAGEAAVKEVFHPLPGRANLTWGGRLRLRFHLFKNMVSLKRMGYDRLPLVVTGGSAPGGDSVRKAD
ncbi:MAG: hypothetical protein AB1641_28410 [Thermodesulfobacteriota bacterium]